MGWWDGLWASNKSEDPLGKLDPKLRDFLEKESPVKYNTQAREAKPTSQSVVKSPQTTKEGEPSVPKESDFQDGRYAHLWKNYRPLAEIEAETKSDHEKLMDVLEGYKARKQQIGRAALENCALEQVDWRKCMMNPSFSDRMTLCRTQVRKFEKCYMTQARLLKALGYLSTADRSPEVEEEIQMHADKLFQQMMVQEAEVDAAKAEGKPIPRFEPLIPKKPLAATAAGWHEFTPEQQEKLKLKLESVPEVDRAAETEAFRAEMRARAEIGERVRALWQEQEAERNKRKEMGQETAWDRVVGFLQPAAEKEANNQSKPAEEKK